MTDIHEKKFLYKLAKNQGIYFSSLIFERGVSFFLIPIYTHALSPDAYGVMAVLLAFTALLAFGSSLGIENGLLRFLQTADDPQKFQSTVFWGMVTLALIGTGIMIFFHRVIANMLLQTPGYGQFVILAALILFFDTIIRFYQYRVVSQQTSKQYFSLGVFRGGLTILVTCLYLLVFRLGLRGVFFANLTVSGLLSVSIGMVFYKKLRFQFDSQIFKKIAFFGLPMMWISVFITCLHFSDRFLIVRYLGLSHAGQYSVAYKLGMMMHLAVNAFSIGSIPFVSSVQKHKQDIHIYATVFGRSMVLYLTIFVLIGLLIKPVFLWSSIGRVLVHPDYFAGISIVPMVLLGYVFYGAYVHFSLGFYDRKKTQGLMLIAGFGLSMNILLNIMMIPRWGIQGAAFSTLVAFFIMAMLAYAGSKKLWNVNYPVRSTVVRLCAAVVCLLLNGFYRGRNVLIPSILFLIFITVFVVPVIKEMKRDKLSKV